nr:integrase domain-containing protein [Paraburkholderia sp. J67]
MLLEVTRGTKGGRDRVVPIEEKYAVLEAAARLANPLTGSTVPADRTLKQWRDSAHAPMPKCNRRQSAW